MTTYTFVPQPFVSGVDWDTADAWSTGSVPDDPFAAVVIDASTAQPLPGQVYTTTIDVESGQAFSAGSLELGSGMTLFLDGTLDVTGATTINGELEIGSLLQTGSFVNNGPFLFGSGQIDAAGSFDNVGSLEGSNLLIDAATFTNTGDVSTSSSTLTVITAPGGFENLENGVLTGGSFGTYNGNLYLNVGGAITVDASDITLDGSDIQTYDAVKGAYVPIEQTLTSVAASGTLTISGDHSFGNLTVSGDLALTGTISTTGLTVTSTGVVTSTSYQGAILGSVRNDGLIQFTTEDGSVTIGGAVTGTGTIEFGAVDVADYEFRSVQIMEAAGTLDLTGPASNTIQFTNSAGSLDLLDPAAFTGVIDGFEGPVNTTYGLEPLVGYGTDIVLGGVADSAITSQSYTGDAAGGTLVIEAGGQTIDLAFAGDYTDADFAFAADGSSGTVITDTACFTTGTRIATADGDCAVENIIPGMRVRLHDGGTAPVVWVGHRRVRAAARLDPVRIRAGALDGARPWRDLVVSPDHALFLDGVLIPAGLLVNGDTVLREPRESVTYFHVELDRHAILLAEGAAAESYLDTGNRGQFANAPIVALHAAIGTGSEPGDPCAPMVFDGPVLDAVRARLAVQAADRAA